MVRTWPEPGTAEAPTLTVETVVPGLGRRACLVAEHRMFPRTQWHYSNYDAEAAHRVDLLATLHGWTYSKKKRILHLRLDLSVRSIGGAGSVFDGVRCACVHVCGSSAMR